MHLLFIVMRVKYFRDFRLLSQSEGGRRCPNVGVGEKRKTLRREVDLLGCIFSHYVIGEQGVWRVFGCERVSQR